MTTGKPHIHYLKRQNIDPQRWDECIGQAANSLVYALHFYLDHMADHQWDALVMDDYRAVMPLPWRRKAGIRYLYQPAFTQQSGIFYRPDAPAALPVHPPPPLNPTAPPAPPSALADSFLHQLRSHFRFAEIYLNYGNPYPGLPTRTNFILPLDAPYARLAAGYKKDLVRNLKLAAAASLDYLRDFDLPTSLDAYRREYASRTPYIRPEDYRHFEQLCLLMKQRGQLLVRAVTGPKQQLLATAVLFRDHNRLYLLQSTTLPEGRKTGANHFLLDQLIREWADSGLTLDFEGSEVPGIAHFYENFGSSDQPYFFYRHNQLNWLFRLLKK